VEKRLDKLQHIHILCNMFGCSKRSWSVIYRLSSRIVYEVLFINESDEWY